MKCMNAGSTQKSFGSKDHARPGWYRRSPACTAPDPRRLSRLAQALAGACLAMYLPQAGAQCSGPNVVTVLSGQGVNTFFYGLNNGCVEFAPVVKAPSVVILSNDNYTATAGTTLWLGTQGSALTYQASVDGATNSSFNQAGHDLTYASTVETGAAVMATITQGSAVGLNIVPSGGSTTIDSATTLSLVSSNSIDTGTIQLNQNTNLGSSLLPTLSFQSAMTLNNQLSVAGTGAIDTKGQSVTLTGSLSNASGNGSLVISGSGVLNMQGYFYNTGSVSVSAGARLAISRNSLGAPSLVNVDGTLDATGDTAGLLNLQALTGASSGLLSAGSNKIVLTHAQGTYGGTLQGSGGMEISSGSQTLTGANNLSGTTLIDSQASLLLAGGFTSGGGSAYQVDGTLDISGMNSNLSLASLGGAGNVLLGGRTLTLTNASGTIGGTVSGVGGALTIAGGTETLTGNSQYTGMTTINPGATLVLSGGGSIAIPSALLDNGTLAFENGTRIWGASIMGSGGLLVSGATATLTASNGYSGPTTIASGSVLNLSGAGSIASSAVVDNGLFDISATSAGASIASLSGSGSVQLGTQDLTITQGAGNLAGTISGSGGLIVAGGQQSLSGPNDYSGNTSIQSGATLILSGSAASSRSPVFNDDGTLQLANTAGVLGSLIQGAGSLVVSSGTATLSAMNTYAGSTSIASGAALALTGAGSVGAGTVLDNGSLDISGRSSDLTIASIRGAGGVNLGSNNLTLSNASGSLDGGITGLGGLVIAAGTQTLQGPNTFSGPTTVQQGATLVLSGSGSLADSALTDDGHVDVSGVSAAPQLTSLSGSGTLNLGAQALSLTQASGSFSGVISGTGSLALLAGSETLAGANTYQGGTDVQGGLLTLADGSSLLSGVQVRSAGSVVAGGNVQVAGDVVNAGRLGIGGSSQPTASLSVGGSYTQTANGTLSETITPGSNTMLQVQGAQLNLDGALEVHALPGVYLRSTYLLVNAPAGTTLSGKFASWQVLGLSPADYQFTLTYITDPQVLLTVTALHPFTPPGTELTPNEQQVALVLNQVAGSSSGSLYDRLSAMLGTGDLARALDQVDGQLYSETPQWLLQGTSQEWTRLFDRMDLGQLHDSLPRQQAFAFVDASRGHLIGDGNADALQQSSSALTLGRQFRRGPWELGAAAGTLTLGATRSGIGDGMTASLYRVGVFGGRQWGGLRVGSVLGYTLGQVGYGQARRDASVWTAQARVARDYAVGPADVLTPLLSLELQRLRLGGASESDPVLGLQVGTQVTQESSTLAALREVHAWRLRDLRGDVSVSLGVRHWWQRPSAQTSLGFNAIPGLTFTNWGVSPPRNVLEASAGVHAALRRNLSAELSLQGDYGRSLRSGRIEAHLTWGF